MLPGRPPPVGSLSTGKPFQRGADRLFRFDGGPVALSDLRAVWGNAQAVGRGHVVLFFGASQRRQRSQLGAAAGSVFRFAVGLAPRIGGLAV